MTTPVNELSYEQARAELDQVVSRLEREELNLEEALDLWERGEDLSAYCSQYLDGARARVEARINTRRESETPGPDAAGF